MSAVPDALAAFHFLRPAFLLALPVILVLWWRVRRRATAPVPAPRGVAPHLAAALTVGGDAARRAQPIDLVAAVLALLALAAAGPTWSRAPNPLVADTAPLAIALQLSESMLSPDVAPSRLERARQKIRDVIAERAGARTALIAYAGTAHRVAPLTEDPAVLTPFIEGLSPEVMPAAGRDATAALSAAQAVFASEPTPGAILFVLDEMDRADHAALAAVDGARIVILSVGGGEAARAAMARGTGAAVVAATPDRADVAEITRRVAAAWRAALDRDERLQWEDRGWLLAWPAAALTLLWFRRGWTMRWGAVALVLSGLGSAPAQAAGLADWFLTPDQQGWLAYRDRRYAEAAELFADPMWRGQALFRAGRYAEAAAVFARLDSAEAAFAEGVASIRNRAYRPAIAAFETALKRDPEHPAAARNLEIARAALVYVETAREQSDTGEDRGVGADDVVFDNEAGRGAETERPPEADMRPETAAQWMRTVDTRMADFLRARFALEAARERAP
jgi:Ca-activated chloride channel family protein